MSDVDEKKTYEDAPEAAKPVRRVLAIGVMSHWNCVGDAQCAAAPDPDNKKLAKAFGLSFDGSMRGSPDPHDNPLSTVTQGAIVEIATYDRHVTEDESAEEVLEESDADTEAAPVTEEASQEPEATPEPEAAPAESPA